jgi:hypothetical protein
MDNEALRKEEERLLRAISRGGASRPPLWSSPSKNPTATTPSQKVVITKPTVSPTATAPQTRVLSPRQKNVIDDEERQRLEREALEREKQRERERLEAERLEKEVFEQKRMASRTSLFSWFDTSPPNSPSQSTSEPKAVTQSKGATLVPEAKTSVSTKVPTQETTAAKPQAPTKATTDRDHEEWAKNMDILISSLPSTESKIPPSFTSVESTPIPTETTQISEAVVTTTPTLATRPAHEIAFESAQQKLSTLKWRLASPLGPAQQKDLIMYIRAIIDKVKDFKTYSEAPTDDPSTFPFTELADSFEAFVEAILGSLSLIISSEDRQEIVNQLQSLLQNTHNFIESVHLRRSVVEADNKMRDSLQNLVKTITNTTRKQAERQQQEERQREVTKQQQTNELIEVVQEAAKCAEKISELLKSSREFDSALFKENLTSLVAAVKRVDPYISDDTRRQKIIATTKIVLENAIELQQSGGQSSRLPVLTSITELLRCLTVGLQQ